MAGSESDPLVIRLRDNKNNVLKVHKAKEASTLVASSTMFTGQYSDGTSATNNQYVNAYAPDGFRTDGKIVTPEIETVAFKPANSQVSASPNTRYTTFAAIDVSQSNQSECSGQLLMTSKGKTVGLLQVECVPLHISLKWIYVTDPAYINAVKVFSCDENIYELWWEEVEYNLELNALFIKNSSASRNKKGVFSQASGYWSGKFNFITQSYLGSGFISAFTAHQEVTYEKLVGLKNNQQLVAGQKYRITDYVTTCNNSANYMSAGYEFDLIVTATSKDSLDYKANAVKKDVKDLMWFTTESDEGIDKYTYYGIYGDGLRTYYVWKSTEIQEYTYNYVVTDTLFLQPNDLTCGFLTLDEMTNDLMDKSLPLPYPDDHKFIDDVCPALKNLPQSVIDDCLESKRYVLYRPTNNNTNCLIFLENPQVGDMPVGRLNMDADDLYDDGHQRYQRGIKAVSSNGNNITLEYIGSDEYHLDTFTKVGYYGEDVYESINLTKLFKVVDHFKNSQLDKWQIWYSLDADGFTYNWYNNTTGKGVIYRMIDEYGNDCPYDFKNIMFKRYKVLGSAALKLTNTYTSWTTGVYCNAILTSTTDYKWCFTFSFDELDGTITDHSLWPDVSNNVIKPYSRHSAPITVYSLPNIVLFLNARDGGYEAKDNTFLYTLNTTIYKYNMYCSYFKDVSSVVCCLDSSNIFNADLKQCSGSLFFGRICGDFENIQDKRIKDSYVGLTNATYLNDLYYIEVP